MMAGKFCTMRDDGVIFRETGTLNSTLLHCCEHHRSCGKELLPAPLQKVCRGRADAHDQVKWVFGIQGTEILDKRILWVLIAETGRDQRMLNDVKRPRRLPVQFRAEGFGIFAPGLEIPAKRIKQHYALGLSRKSSRTTERHREENNEPRSRADTTDVNPYGHALRKTSCAHLSASSIREFAS